MIKKKNITEKKERASERQIIKDKAGNGRKRTKK